MKSPSCAHAIFVQVYEPAGQKLEVNLNQPENSLKKKSLNVINVKTDKVRGKQDTDVMLEFNR